MNRARLDAVVENLELGVVAFVVLLNILNAASIVAGRWDHAGFLWILFDREGNPSTWLTSSLLLAAGLLALLSHVFDQPDRRRFWALVAGILTVMSFEEVAQVHELVSGNLEQPGGGGNIAAIWVIPGFVIVVVLAIALTRSLPDLERDVVTGLVVGAAIWVVGSLGFELLAEGVDRALELDPQARRRLIFATLEENIEILGVLVIGRTMLRHTLRDVFPPP